MKISRVMLLGWLTLAASVLSIPQFTSLFPENKLYIVAFISGVLTLLIRWLGGQLGVEPLTVVGLGQLASALLAMPELGTLIPPEVMPYVTAAGAAIMLVARWKSGSDPSSPDTPSGMLFRKP